MRHPRPESAHLNASLRPNYPFCGVQGQATFKLALILAAISPAIGGVLVSGPRGLAKTTLARGLADLICEVDTDAGSGGGSNFITLPLGASEEMLIGTLDLQQVLDRQNVAFRPGLLAQADQGVLYVDEVNLLPDHLVDLLLDVSASGVNRVERDGISHSHAANFILLGTMNPDEGELRPQLADRFGLCVELSNDLSIEQRIQIVKQREAFDENPEAFITYYAEQQASLRVKIFQARSRLSFIQCDDTQRRLIAEKCHAAQVDGMRADLVWLRAAVAHCVFAGREQVEQQDVLAVEALVLGHRRNNNADYLCPNSRSSQQDPQVPADKPGDGRAAFKRPPERSDSESAQSTGIESNCDSENSDHPEGRKDQGTQGDWGALEVVQQLTANLSNFVLSNLEGPKKKALFPQANAGCHVDVSALCFGKVEGNGIKGPHRNAQVSQRVHWFTTLVENLGAWPINRLRFKKQQSSRPVLNLVLLDNSASILLHQQFAKAKAVVLELANMAYLKRESLVVMGFDQNVVNTLLTMRRTRPCMRRWLDQLPASGGTPLREMLLRASAYQGKQLAASPTLQINTYLLSDGRSTQSFDDIRLHGQVCVIDMEEASIKRGKMKLIAELFSARYFSFPQLVSI